MTPAEHQHTRRTRNTAARALAVAFAIEAAERELARLHDQLAALQAPPAATLPAAVTCGPVTWQADDPVDGMSVLHASQYRRPGAPRALLVR